MLKLKGNLLHEKDGILFAPILMQARWKNQKSQQGDISSPAMPCNAPDGIAFFLFFGIVCFLFISLYMIRSKWTCKENALIVFS